MLFPVSPLVAVIILGIKLKQLLQCGLRVYIPETTIVALHDAIAACLEIRMMPAARAQRTIHGCTVGPLRYRQFLRPIYSISEFSPAIAHISSQAAAWMVLPHRKARYTWFD
jgi:hypothetical protein